EGYLFGTANPFSYGGARDSFGFTDMNNADNLGLAITNHDYLVFTITPDSGYQLDLTSFSFRALAKTVNHAAERWALFSSIDGFEEGAQIEVGQTTNESTYVNHVVDLSAASFQGLTNAITFRLYIYGGNESYSAATAFDKVIVRGGVNVVTEEDGYSLWAADAFSGAAEGTDTTASGNPDGDRFNNRQEWTLMLDPLVADEPAVEITAGTSNLVAVYQRRINTGISVDAGWATALTTTVWRVAGDGLTEAILETNDDVETVSATVAIDEAHKFIRIAVEE
uniref:hypothetical protein n=1 Tax=Pontiella sp. TaxID=2837462 RepID=UPI003564EE24